jgi:VCBS repeat-containing protein
VAFSPQDILNGAFGAEAASALTLIAVDGADTRGTVALGSDAVVYDPRGRLDDLAARTGVTDRFDVTAEGPGGARVSGTVDVEVAGVNDAPLAADDSFETDEATRVRLDVTANDTDAEAGPLDVVGIDTTGTQGAVTLNADGTLTYDPRGAFDALNNGDTASDTFAYTIRDADGGTDTATANVRIFGLNDLETLVESFERDLLPAERTSGFAQSVTGYQETDGEEGAFSPTDGSRMAQLEARGSTVPALESFLGLEPGGLPKDSDGSFPAFGSAIRLSVDVEAGDRVGFDWMFDARDFVTNPPDGLSDNDFALLTVRGSNGTEVFKLTDVRDVGDQGASGFRTSVFTASEAETLVLSIGVINYRGGEISGPEAQNSFLLVDNFRINGEISDGYQVVDSQAGGALETLAPPTA